MMSRIKGPAIFLAQFAQDVPPDNTLPALTRWAKDLGYLGIQIPGWESCFLDLDQAATSKQYCDDLQGQTNGLAITEIATHLLGQLVGLEEGSEKHGKSALWAGGLCSDRAASRGGDYQLARCATGCRHRHCS